MNKEDLKGNNITNINNNYKLWNMNYLVFLKKFYKEKKKNKKYIFKINMAANKQFKNLNSYLKETFQLKYTEDNNK